jgi:hypothetical protein
VPVRSIKKVNVLRRLSRGRTVFVACALLVPVLILFAISLGVERSFLVEARTSLLRISFEGANAWRLPEATVCRPRELPDRTARSAPGAACTAFDQTTEEFRDLVLPWPEQATVILRAEPLEEETRLRIVLTEGLGETFPPGTEIVVAPGTWRTAGALLFSGRAVLGTILGSGERHYLHSAEWEARQTSLATRVLRTASDTVMSGEAMRGGQLAVALREFEVMPPRIEVRPATVFGHVTPAETDDGLPIFAVTLVSEPGRTELQLGHYGLDDVATIRPTFVDAAASSVLLIAAIAIISLAAAATQVVGDLMFSGRGDKEEPKRRPASSRVRPRSWLRRGRGPSR